MKSINLGAGIIGVSTAWHLLEQGHEATVVERQPGAALETSFANAAQISVSYCEPWVNRDELLRIEPALQQFAHRIVGGIYAASDESGDARVFTQALAARCMARGAEFLYNHDVVRLEKADHTINSIAVCARSTGTRDKNDHKNLQHLKADQFVVACGSYTAPLLRTVGVDLPIYPGKGYRATFPILCPEAAPKVSTIDDEMKIAISRLGDQLRVAGTIEVGGYDLSLDTPLAGARCQMLSDRRWPLAFTASPQRPEIGRSAGLSLLHCNMT